MFGKKEKNVRVVDVTTKIVLTFTVFILLSNLASNYVNLRFNRSELLKLMNQLLIKDLKTMYSFCNNQYEIYRFDMNLEESVKSIESKGLNEIKNNKAVVLGIKKDGTLHFQASKIPKTTGFSDRNALEYMLASNTGEESEGHLRFRFNGEDYFGIFKYNPKWEIFILRGEEEHEFYSESTSIFITVSVIIVFITVISAVMGIFILRRILRFIRIITRSIMQMVSTSEMKLIDLKGATNDDITYLGVAFNSLSNTVGNLIQIFQKFANSDIVAKIGRAHV